MKTWAEMQAEPAKIQYAVFPEHRRILVISDIHGNLPYLKALLSEVSFQASDILILLGDFAEKGPSNLDTLRYIMQLCRDYTVYPVCGNCDAMWDHMLPDDESAWAEQGELLRSYLLFRHASIVNEMAERIGMPVREDTDMAELARRVNEAYAEELGFFRSLPQILETEHYTFVHGGLADAPLSEQKKYDVMTKPAFYQSGLSFRKYVIVGHWPTCLYDTVKQDCSPVIDRSRRIISIDGANVLKRDGQLNALVIPEAGSDAFSWVWYDDLPKAEAMDAQTEAETSHNIIWTDNAVEILERGEKISTVRQLSTGVVMKTLTDYLYEAKGAQRTEDMTDDVLAVSPGDIVTVVEETGEGTFIKKNGRSGWYYGRLRML